MLDKKTTELTTTEHQLSRRAFGRSLVALAVTGSMMLTGCSKPQSSSDAKPASGTSTTAATGSAPAPSNGDMVVVGGVGQIWGAVLAALGLGVSGTVLEIGMGAVIAKIILLVLVVLFIQKRPQGLFALKGRFVE